MDDVDVGLDVDDCVDLDVGLDVDDCVDFFLLNCFFLPIGLRRKVRKDGYILDRRVNGVFIFDLYEYLYT